MDLVLEAVAEALDTTPDALTENSSSQTVANWDSLRQIIIAKVIEQRFDLTLSDDDLENLSSIGSIRALLARRLGDTRDAQPQAGEDLATGVPSVDMVIAMLNEALDAPAGAIGPDSSAETVANWDSLRQIIIAKVIEQRCAITLSDDDLEALTSVSSIRALLVQHGVAHRSDHGAPAARQDMGIAPAEAAPTSTRRLREDLRTSPSMATIFDVAKQLDDGAITTDREPSLRVAVLGSLTTDFIAAAIACGVLQERAIPVLYNAPFGVYVQEILDPDSMLYKFRPDIVVIAPDAREAISDLPIGSSRTAVDEEIDGKVAHFTALWKLIAERTHAGIIQHLLVPQNEVYCGLAERRMPAAPANQIRVLNDRLIEAAGSKIAWVELDRLAEMHGLGNWNASRFYFNAKLPFDPQYLPAYLNLFRSSLRLVQGRTKKVLALDLDNTLWGGVIGDDGVAGILLGPDTHAGEAFTALGRYVRDLASRGVILAACSKNDPSLATEAFSHDHSPLKREDFSAFEVSWGDKATGLREIARALNVGIDSIVFADDNPFECDLVREVLPEVEVVELGADPSAFIGLLDAQHWFDISNYTGEDLKRTESYRGRVEADRERQASADIGAYLAGLQMTGVLSIANRAEVERLAQMEKKTNQFNTTTRRYSVDDIGRFIDDPSALVLGFRLRDRHADHGLVSSLIGFWTEDTLEIDSWQGAVSVSEDFLEIDLGKVFGLSGCDPGLLDPKTLTSEHAFRLFLFLFGPEAFMPSEQGRTIHQIALESGKRWEERVARDLSRVVFREVFPILSAALGERDRDRPALPGPAWLEEVRQGALILLYRLLFVLYAEDRNLLPDESGPYAEFALTRIRIEVAKMRGDHKSFSPRAAIYWARLKAIFTAIARGDDDLGIPPYNGGLFEAASAPILERVELPDSVVAEVVFHLSHVEGEREPKYVNYRDLSVQQLGSIYERILEFGLRLNDEGVVEVDADADDRHDSGSYYTPEALVGLIIDRSVGPLVVANARTFADAAERLASDRRPLGARRLELEALDSATALLGLKICDPAMGSGHFLVTLVDWLADRVLEATADAAALADWADYASPVLGRVAAIRARILDEARRRRWPLVEAQLDDRHVIRRMILKRVIHGVDKNPMAVELAKVSLWLHTFTVGAPLSFLDHHLRCGDSLVGAWVRPTLDAVARAGGLLTTGSVDRVEKIAAKMTEIEEITDNDVAEVAASKGAFGVIEEATHDLGSFFSLMTAQPLLGVDLNPKIKPPKKSPAQLRAAGATTASIATAEKAQGVFDRAAAFKAVLEKQYGDPLKIAAGDIVIEVPPDEGDQPLLDPVEEGARRRRIAAALVAQASGVAASERFLHWPIAFPNVWRRLDQPVPEGGFDAVIGNPPYVRQERLAPVKRALAADYRTFAGTADLYVYFFEQGLRLAKPGGRVGYVVNNKWLKAGYAEGLRALLSDPERAETESLVDFGHAKSFFPGADVFPSVVVLRRPDGLARAEAISVAVPSRETKPDDDLAAVVEARSFPLAFADLNEDGWVLEPKPVLNLLNKIQQAGVPLAEYADTKPLYGIKTGFNEAFLIDTPTRDRLVEVDPGCAKIIKPYLRGQDVSRWSSPDSGLHMILLKSSSDFAWPWAGEPTEDDAERVFAEAFPSIHDHVKRFESFPDAKTRKLTGLRHREDHGRFWWELRSCAYYDAFERPKILYVDICWSPSFLLDNSARLSGNTTYFLPGADAWLAAVMNAPVGWWYSWRKAQKGKDDALRYFSSFVEGYPVPPPCRADVQPLVASLAAKAEEIVYARSSIHDWLMIEFSLQSTGSELASPEQLSADGFAAAVRAGLPKRRSLSAAEVARLKHEHRTTVEPARRAAAEAAVLERQLSDMVNAAYGLTPEDVRLIWETAPPRMPLAAPEAHFS